jgi:ribosomal protein L23
VDRMFEEFMKIFLKAFDRAFPLKKTRVNTNNSKQNKHWYTEELKTLGQEVKEAYIELRTHKCQTATTNYKVLNRHYISEINKAKKKSNNEKIEHAQNKAKAGWEIIKKGTHHQDLKIELNKETLGPQETANIFNAFFSTAVTEITDSEIKAKNWNISLTAIHK